MNRPNIPEDLSVLSADELKALSADVKAYYDAQRNHADGPVLAECEWAGGVMDAITARTADVKAAADRLAALDANAATFGADETDVETVVDAGTTDDAATIPPVVEAAVEAGTLLEVEALAPSISGEQLATIVETAVTAALSSPAVAARRPSVTALRAAAPAGGLVVAPGFDNPDRNVLVASAALSDRAPGTRLDWGGYSDALYDVGRSRMGSGGQAKSIVASIHADFGEEMVLSGNSAAENARIIREAGDRQRVARADYHDTLVANGYDARGLVADGGLCGPTDAYRDIRVIVDLSRPVADSLTNVGADRSAINFVQTPTLSDVVDGIDVITVEMDEDGHTKACMALACPSIETAQVRGISVCMTVGNMQEFSNPEWVRATTQKLMSFWARIADSRLLDDFVAAAVQIDHSEIYGTVRGVVRALASALAGYRSADRLTDVPVVWYAPFWLRNQMIGDLVGGPYDLALARQALAFIGDMLAQLNVTPVWYLDGPTGSQIYGSQGPGDLIPYPNPAKTFLFAEGVWGSMTGPSLDFGFRSGVPVRDSTMNRANTVQYFAEIFETAVNLGGAPTWELDLDVCPTGAYAPPADALDPACDLS